MNRMLPRPLRRWRAALQPFPDDLALVLGRWLNRLDAMLGPLHRPGSEPGDDPDGYDGLTRRGTTERMLVDQWALARTQPLEFLRRVSMSELFYYRIARSHTSLGRCAAVLFDAGPDQLGAPRMVHLALLLLLARRASDAGVEFGWGILQNPIQGLSTRSDPAACRRLLAARTSRPPQPENLARWWQILQAGDSEQQSAPDEVLIVGPADLPLPEATELQPLLIGVEEMLIPGRSALEVSLKNQGGVQRRVELEAPPPLLTARLLRNPFTPAPGRAIKVDFSVESDSNPLLIDGDRKVMLRLASGALAAFPIPGSPRDTPGFPRFLELPQDLTVIAAGWRHRRPVALVEENERLALYGWPSKQHRIELGLRALSIFQSLPLRPLVFIKNHSLSLFSTALFEHELVLIRFGFLYNRKFREAVDERRFGTDGPLLDELPSGTSVVSPPESVPSSAALAMYMQRSGSSTLHDLPFDLISRSDGPWSLVGSPKQDEPAFRWAWQPFDGQHRPSRAQAHCIGLRGLFGFSRQDRPLLVAIEEEVGRWQLIHGEVHKRVDVPRGHRVIGAWDPYGATDHDRIKPELLVLATDRTEILAIGNSRIHRYQAGSEPIRHTAVGTRQPVLACLTDSGDLFVLALDDGSVRLQVRTTEGT